MKCNYFLIIFLVLYVFSFSFIRANDGDIAVINVAEDAFVQAGGTSGTAFGTTDPGRLIVKNDANAGTRRLTFLKFIIPEDINIEEIGNAKLSLYIVGANTGVPETEWVIYGIEDDSWKESSITFNNKPSYDEVKDKIIQVPSVSTVGTNVRINITRGVKGTIGEDRVVSVCFDASIPHQKGDVIFHSKENGNPLYIPQLLLGKEDDPGPNPGEEPEPLEIEIAERVISKIRLDRLTREKEELEEKIGTYLTKYNETTGIFSDVSYEDQSRTDWKPLEHLYRLKEMSIAYTEPGNKYFEDVTIYNKIFKGLQYWYSRWPTSSNWWYNEIATPREIGLVFVALYPGKEKIIETEIFEQLTAKAKSVARPDLPVGPTRAGANKSDIAMNWIYRSCVTRNLADFELGVTQGFIPVVLTTGEGIQHDWSYRQHGNQLYIGGYGTELMQFATRQAYYLVGTPYALSGEKLNILSQFVRNTYLNVIRGQRMSYNVLGRGITRTNNTARLSDAEVFAMLKEIDSENAMEYDNAVKRVNKTVGASYGVKPLQTHYYRGEYTLHQRPYYTFDVRMASSRMVRSEYDINENRSGFFLTDGATSLLVDGEEYGSIIPMLDWKKIPGTTVPDLKQLRRADSYIFNGISSYSGGVTDGLYGVTAFDMINNQSLYEYNDDIGYNGVPNPQRPRLAALNFGAKKSWFMFENEIVCLGAGIRSGHEENLFTTVNQAEKRGEVVVSVNGTETVQGLETKNYNDIDWVLNDNVAYFFPKKGNIYVSNETRTGSWKDVNNSGSSSKFSKDVFTLWFDHGVKPSNETYIYIMVPYIMKEEARTYPISNIEILENTDAMQVVYHKQLKMYGLVFYKAGKFTSDNLTVQARSSCVVWINDSDKEEILVYIADPQKRSSSIVVEIETPYSSGNQKLNYRVLDSNHFGKSLEFKIPKVNVGLKKIVDSANEKLLFYPNPVKRGESVVVKVGEEKDYTAEIKDISGRTVLSSKRPEIDTTSLSSGIYLITLKDNVNTRSEKYGKLIVE